MKNQVLITALQELAETLKIADDVAEKLEALDVSVDILMRIKKLEAEVAKLKSPATNEKPGEEIPDFPKEVDAPLPSDYESLVTYARKLLGKDDFRTPNRTPKQLKAASRKIRDSIIADSGKVLGISWEGRPAERCDILTVLTDNLIHPRKTEIDFFTDWKKGRGNNSIEAHLWWQVRKELNDKRNW